MLEWVDTKLDYRWTLEHVLMGSNPIGTAERSWAKCSTSGALIFLIYKIEISPSLETHENYMQ